MTSFSVVTAAPTYLIPSLIFDHLYAMLPQPLRSDPLEMTQDVQTIVERLIQVWFVNRWTGFKAQLWVYWILGGFKRKA